MEVKRRKRGRPSKAVVSPPVHRMVENPEIAKAPQYILNVRHGWFKVDNGKLIPINSGAGASMAETAAKSP